MAGHPVAVLAADVGRIDALVAAGADASAALALVEPLASFMLSGAPGGRHLATVVLAGQADEHHAEGASAALALVGALATALAGLSAGRSDNAARSDERTGFRLN